MAQMTFPPEGRLGEEVRAGPVLLTVEQTQVPGGGWPSLRCPAGRRHFGCTFVLHERRVSVLKNELKLSCR